MNEHQMFTKVFGMESGRVGPEDVIPSNQLQTGDNPIKERLLLVYGDCWDIEGDPVSKYRTLTTPLRQLDYDGEWSSDLGLVRDALDIMPEEYNGAPIPVDIEAVIRLLNPTEVRLAREGSPAAYFRIKKEGTQQELMEKINTHRSFPDDGEAPEGAYYPDECDIVGETDQYYEVRMWWD